LADFAAAATGKLCERKVPVAEKEKVQIVETAREARGAEPGPSVRNVLVWSLGLVVVAFVVVYLVFFRP
jgi:hypothetical protein